VWTCREFVDRKWRLTKRQRVLKALVLWHHIVTGVQQGAPLRLKMLDSQT